MTEKVRIEWLDIPLPADCEDHLLPGLRAGIDENGAIWGWAGLLVEKHIALALAEMDKEPRVVDQQEPFLRVGWMRSNLVTDRLGEELLSQIESKVRACRLH